MPPHPRLWFRFWSESLESQKVQRLKPPLFKHWVNLMCLANVTKPRGTLPSLPDIAFRLRIKEEVAAGILEELTALRLVDAEGDRFVMHDWADWQRERDVSPGYRDDSVTDNHGNRDDSVTRGRGREEKGDPEAEGEGEKTAPSAPLPSALMPNGKIAPFPSPSLGFDWDALRHHYETLNPGHVLDDRAKKELREFHRQQPEWVWALVNQGAGKGFGYIKRAFEDCIAKNEPPSTLKKAGRR